MKKLSLMILVAIAAFSCAKEPVMPDNGQGKGVTVRFTTPDFNQVSTRVTDESSVKDVWVLQYKAGNLVAASKKLLKASDGILFQSGQAIELTGLEDMTAATNQADSTQNFVAFLANLNEIGVTEAQIDALTTVADLNAFRVDVGQSTTFGTVLPMRGFYYGGISTVASNQLNVTLERAVAKINFTINPDNFKLGDGTPAKMGIISMKLCKTPKQFGMTKNFYQPALPVGSANGVTPQGFVAYPAKTAGDFFEITENLSTAGARVFTAYVAENVRGSYNSIANNGDKKPANVNASAPGEGDYLTYIEVVGEFVENNLVKVATYKIYLGGNATGDMNLIANTTYNITTYLYGANTTDTRITIGENPFNQNTLNNLKAPANSYIVNATGIEQVFTIPLSQLAEGWAAINATITDPAQKVDIVDLLSSEANWSAETLWKTWTGDNSTSVTATGANADLKRYMEVTVPASVVNGHNCVIALYDRRANVNAVANPNFNKIMWSWHLWITDYEPSATANSAQNGKVEQYVSSAFLQGGLFNGKYLMDRNLGSTITGASNIATMMSTPASATTANAVALRGMMYQWGRKDVFTPTTSTADGTTGPDISTSTPLYDKEGMLLFERANTAGADQGILSLTGANLTAAGITNNVLYAVQNPLHFIANGGDWTGIGSSANSYWANGIIKGAFDPCPAGWRVPNATTFAVNNPWSGLNNQLPTEPINNGGENKDIFEWFSNGVNNNTATRATAGRIFKDQTTSSPSAWYPASGGRSSASAAFYNVGAGGYYWSSSVTGLSGYYLNFASTSVRPANSSVRADGFPVRCIQE